MIPTKYSTAAHGPDYWMQAGSSQLGGALNTPEALKGESLHSLPPHHGRKGYLVDKYPACPLSWVRSTGVISSYFVPIIQDNGMWLDFNKCGGHDYNVAIVVSVQGVNAVTGLPCEDAQLEQYVEKCPKHNIEFGHGRLCAKCNYKWPKQNYICTTGQPSGSLWIDGFRAADGAVRQYVLSAEKARGVANAIMGEKRVFAVGVSFFLSKDKKLAAPMTSRRVGSVYSEFKKMYSGGCGQSVSGDDMAIGSSDVEHDVQVCNFVDTKLCSTAGSEGSYSSYSGGAPLMSKSLSGSLNAKGRSSSGGSKGLGPGGQGITRQLISAQVTQLEVAAGARIDQRIYDDPNPLDFWRDKLEAILVVNYCLETEADQIIAAGEADVDGKPEGFMQGLPIGN